MCFCEIGVRIDDADGFVQVAWPDGRTVAGGGLNATAGFGRTLTLLPDAPAGLLYFNPGALPGELIEDVAGDHEFNMGAVTGIGMSWQGDPETARLSFVIAVQSE